MTARKTERLMGLLIMLLVQRRYATKDRIRTQLYRDMGDAAFEKMFERDKEDLRSLGVPIEMGALDAYFDDEQGYRIRPDEFALPEITLEADEAAVVGLAGRVWEQTRLAQATTDAVRKLAAQGAEVDLEALDVVQPQIGSVEPAFPMLCEATATLTPVVFDYATPGQDPAPRHLQPWGLVRFSGRWYVVGWDTDRESERMFRLSRIHGEPRTDGAAGSYAVPEGTDVQAMARRLAPPVNDEPARVLVRPGTGAALRRVADRITPGVTGPRGTEVWDRLDLRRADIASDVLACGPDAWVEAPESLRDEVVTRLRAAVGA